MRADSPSFVCVRRVPVCARGTSGHVHGLLCDARVRNLGLLQTQARQEFRVCASWTPRACAHVTLR
jgi:hypothetical protein